MDKMLSPTPNPILPQSEAFSPTESQSRRWLLWFATGLAILTLGIILGFFGAKFLNQSQSQPQLTPVPTQAPSPQSPSPTPTSDPTTNWKIYIDQKYGFQIKYPENWFSNDGSGVFYESEQRMKESEGGPNSIILTISVNEIYPAKISSSDPVGTTKITGDKIINTKVDEVEFNDLWFSKIKQTVEMGSQTDATSGTFYIIDKNSYQINVGYNEENLSRQKVSIDQILSTFKFISPSG